MFAKTIVLSDAFLDLPMSARCLYFTLGMLADDDGFVNSPRAIMRQCGASDDDMKILLAKKFVLLFESGVIVIKHWRINNYLRSDRYIETKYSDEKALLTVEDNGSYRMGDQESNANAKDLRKQAYEESELPCSFDYKIRNAFDEKPCPICGFPMRNVEKGAHRPTIQHNIPISLGGKHELSNISVICSSCNFSLGNKPTDELNNKEVVSEWEKLAGIPNNGIPPGIPSIGKDSIGKVSLEEGKDRERKGESERETQLDLLSADERKEKIKFWRGRIDFMRSQNFDAGGMYDLAKAKDGITMEEIDSYKEENADG